MFISGFTMSTLCSRCNKNYDICVTMLNFPEFFLLNFPFLTPGIISEVLARARREFSGYFGASQRSSRVPPFLPSNTFLCRCLCLCLCPFLPSHFSFVRSLSQPASMAHPGIHFSAINIRVHGYIDYRPE